MQYIANQKTLVEIMERHGFNFKKGFGQNFLIDQNILRKIVASSGTTKETTVIEIGPGAGALTQFLSEAAKQVYAFEVDHKLLPILEETVLTEDNVEVFFADFLKVDFADYPMLAESGELRVVANLPYYITTPILEKLIDWYVEEQPPLKSATVMMQKEVAQRLAAEPNTKAYGSLSIFVQLFAEVKLSFMVSKNVFIPAPRVDSAIVQLSFKKCEYFETMKEAESFTAFVRLAFSMRRKTLVNNLKESYESAVILDALAKHSIDARTRAEQLNISQFIDIFKEIDEKE